MKGPPSFFSTPNTYSNICFKTLYCLLGACHIFSTHLIHLLTSLNNIYSIRPCPLPLCTPRHHHHGCRHPTLLAAHSLRRVLPLQVSYGLIGEWV